MFSSNHIDHVDWKAVEKHYSQYSLAELEEMTYPKKGQHHVTNDLAALQRFETVLN
jgi:hypothetical protein